MGMVSWAMAVQWGGSAWNEGDGEGEDAEEEGYDDSADYLDPAWF